MGMRCQRSDQSGASSVEYALLVALIAVVITVVLAVLGTNVNQLYDVPL